MPSPVRTATTAAACLLLTAGLFGGAPAQAAQPTPTGATPSNCTQLNKKYPHGISNRHFTKRQWIKKGATAKGAYRPRLYRKVASNLDRDKDHIACEK
jgi:hypothetical protein